MTEEATRRTTSVNNILTQKNKHDTRSMEDAKAGHEAAARLKRTKMRRARLARLGPTNKPKQTGKAATGGPDSKKKKVKKKRRKKRKKKKKKWAKGDAASGGTTSVLQRTTSVHNRLTQNTKHDMRSMEDGISGALWHDELLWDDELPDLDEPDDHCDPMSFAIAFDLTHEVLTGRRKFRQRSGFEQGGGLVGREDDGRRNMEAAAEARDDDNDNSWSSQSNSNRQAVMADLEESEENGEESVNTFFNGTRGTVNDSLRSPGGNLGPSLNSGRGRSERGRRGRSSTPENQAGASHLPGAHRVS